MASSPLFIGVSGIIGAGKSTLVSELSKATGWTATFEPVETNPYLDDFYADQERYGFAMQVFLLNERYRQHQSVVWGSKNVIQDRTIYEDPVFAKLLYDSGKMSSRDYETYKSLFTNMTNFLHRPDVIVYLDVSVDTAMKRIAARGRECEVGIPREYLEKLKAGYEHWIDTAGKVIPILRIDWNEIPSNYCQHIKEQLKSFSTESARMIG